MSLSEFLKQKKSLSGFKNELDPDIIGLDLDIIRQEHINGMQIADHCRVDHMAKNFAWMRGNQNCFTGFANSGKTQFTLFMFSIKSKVDNWKWCIWSPEMRRANFVDGKVKVHYNRLAYELMATTSGKTPFEHVSKKFKVPFMTIEEKEFWFEWIRDHFIFLEPVERKIDNIYDTLHRVYDNYGVDGFLIDPYKNIDVEANVRDDHHLHRAFAKYQDLAVRTNTVMNWIAHPKSGVSRVATKNGVETAVPCNQYMLAGGAAWENSMDGIYSIHRPNILEDATDPAVEFYNLKERDQLLVAEKGIVKDIMFDVKTRRYIFNGYSPFGFNETNNDVFKSSNLDFFENETKDTPF